MRPAFFGLLSRTIFREIFVNSLLGAILFALIVFLQLANALFEYLVSGSGSPRTVAYLFALVLPQALPYAVPLGVLVGTLITLSRMSADGEITAMRAAGVAGRRVAPPILAFAFFAMLAALASSLWLTPWAIRTRFVVENQLIAHELTAAVRERIFEEQFPNTILYVTEVPPASGPTSRWRGVFLADVTPSENRPANDKDRGDGPKITLSMEAIAQPDVPNNRVQLKLTNEHNYWAGKDAQYYTSSEASDAKVLQAQKPGAKRDTHPATEMDSLPLYQLAYRNREASRLDVLEARIELHRRLAFPVACLLLALTGIPLGITTRRAGKSSAVVLTLVLAFVYEMAMISMIRMAGQGTLPPGIAVWTPNILFALFGLIMLARLESPGDRDISGRIWNALRSLGKDTLERAPRLPRRERGFGLSRFPVLVHIVDTYVLSSFLFYFGVWLVSFVLMYQVFNFFELLQDMIKNRPPTPHVLAYFLYLTPRLIEYFTPLSVLAAVLVVFGVLAKNNEITAFKACGISSYRLAAPVLAGGLCLSGSLYAFNERWVPWADRQQDGYYNEIKGKPAQTFLNPEKKWVYNSSKSRFFYYKYFDGVERVMSGVNVYEIDPRTWRLKKHISAERARWEPGLNKWVYENGWSRDIDGDTIHVDAFPGATRTFAELDETPDYFLELLQQNVQSEQMNTHELRTYIAELEQSGFNTLRFQVELERKFSVPLFAFILAAVSIPFAFLAGNRGAMAGVGISLAIFLAYYVSQEVAGQMGTQGYLQPSVSAWAPDVVFSLFALYFLGRMRT